MTIANVRRIDGVLMIAVPGDLVSELNLEEGTEIGLEAVQSRLFLSAKPFLHYDLDELIQQCDPVLPMTEEDQVWLNLKSVGREIL